MDSTNRNDGTVQNHAMQLIAEAAEILGWQISFRQDQEEIEYIIIGTAKAVDEITTKIEDWHDC